EFEPKKSKIWQWAFIGLLILLVILCGACFWEYKKINCEKDEVVVSVAPKDVLEEKVDMFKVEVTDPIEEAIVSELSQIKIFFNNKVDEETLNSQNFYALWGIEDKISAIIQHLPSVNYATLVFDKPIIADPNGTTKEGITVVLSSGIRDLQGNSLQEKIFNIYLINSDEYTGWPVYKDSRYGYEVKYPASWFDLPNFGAPETDKYFSNENVTNVSEMSESGIFLTIRGKGHGDLSATEWSVREPEQQGFSVESRKYITVSGVAAVDQIENFNTSVGGEGGFRRIVYLVDSVSGKLLTLSFYVLQDKNLLNSDEIEKIIKSFTL
ncbi:MAG: Ig-like domain-containing protein, partial [Patescibacteria group bacterium]